MQKLKNKIFDALIEKKCTAAEINFLVYISHFQDNIGLVQGVYYKDICTALEISYQKFYDIIDSLKNKEIIEVKKRCYNDWDIQIIGNDFTYKDAFQEGYISTSHNIFWDARFLKLKAREKLLAIDFLRISLAGQGSYYIGVEKLFKKYTELFHISKRVIRNYLTKLKQFFIIGIKNRKYWIKPKEKVFKSIGKASDADTYNHFVCKTVCRRKRVTYDENSLKDISTLLKQYQTKLGENTVVALSNLIEQSIVKANERISSCRKWQRVLKPKLIHKIIKATGNF